MSLPGRSKSIGGVSGSNRVHTIAEANTPHEVMCHHNRCFAHQGDSQTFMRLIVRTFIARFVQGSSSPSTLQPSCIACKVTHPGISRKVSPEEDRQKNTWAEIQHLDAVPRETPWNEIVTGISAASCRRFEGITGYIPVCETAGNQSQTRPLQTRPTYRSIRPQDLAEAVHA